MSSVKNGKATISILNIVECEKEMTYIHINKILYDNEVDYDVHFTNSEHNNDVSRIDRIKKLIKSNHMNALERESIFKICEQYTEIIYLEEDKLTHTNPIKHTIKLKPDNRPIYKKPYRLLFSQQAEINKQISKMESDNIIQHLLNPWNAFLLLEKF